MSSAFMKHAFGIVGYICWNCIHVFSVSVNIFLWRKFYLKLVYTGLLEFLAQNVRKELLLRYQSLSWCITQNFKPDLAVNRIVEGV
jgi:hypothetical protein